MVNLNLGCWQTLNSVYLIRERIYHSRLLTVRLVTIRQVPLKQELMNPFFPFSSTAHL